MSTPTITRTARQDQLTQIAELLDECRHLSKALGVEILHANYPSMTKSFFHSRFELLVSLTPATLASAIGYPDPVGETAVRRAMTRRKAQAPQRV